MNQQFLIIHPKYGLCNQLLAISKSIIFGLITKRDIIFRSFQMDYRDINNICEFHDIIDIDFLEQIIKNIKIYSNKNCNGIKIKTNTEIEISMIKNFLPLLLLENNKNEQYLDIENPISGEIPYQYYNLFKYININIKFTDKYINIANNIKKSINLSDYICVHLRLEDDALNFMKLQTTKNLDINYINNIYKTKYINELDILINQYPNKQIFICTSLEIDSNINNSFYKEIKQKYNLIDKNNFIDKLTQYREIYGIIDYIIAKDANIFIGADWSSFSINLYDYFINLNKTSRLIDIWKTVINL
jgi:hypothetical protein